MAEPMNARHDRGPCSLSMLPRTPWCRAWRWKEWSTAMFLPNSGVPGGLGGNSGTNEREARSWPRCTAKRSIFRRNVHRVSVAAVKSGLAGEMAAAKGSQDVEIAPLRSLDDYLMESARFQIPNLKDAEKWANRVMNNLLYYQTNYFLTSLLAFLLVGVMHPVKMFYGFLALAVAFGLFYYATNERRTAQKFKRDHPLVSVIIVVTGGYFIVYMLGSVVVFLTGILLPIVVVFIHASMRLRNMKNKLTNKMESVGLKRTPMGIFLESLGQDPEI